MRRRLVATTCALVALALTGCAIPTQNAPSTIPRSQVPFGLLNNKLPTTTSTQPKPPPSLQVKVVFLNATKQLTAVPRVVSPQAPLADVLGTMLQGPSNQEAAQGIVTAIPRNVQVVSVSGPQDQVTVNLNSAFAQIIGNNNEPAVAQIVATIAAQYPQSPFTTGVLFEIDGQRTTVPIANGQQVKGPVTLSQVVTAGG